MYVTRHMIKIDFFSGTNKVLGNFQILASVFKFNFFGKIFLFMKNIHIDLHVKIFKIEFFMFKKALAHNLNSLTIHFYSNDLCNKYN